MNDLSEKDIEVFIEAVGDYFKKTTQEAASVGVAYLARNAFPMNDFTGMIKVSGDYDGVLYFSAPSAMLRHLLMVMKETNHSDENLLDAVGELPTQFLEMRANILVKIWLFLSPKKCWIYRVILTSKRAIMLT